MSPSLSSSAMAPTSSPPTTALWGASLVAAPLLSAASTFFWTDGEYGLDGGLLGILASVFWGLGFVGVFGLLRERYPVYAAAGLLVAMYGVIAGALFAFEDLHAAALGISHGRSTEALAQHPVHAALALWLPGPVYYLNLIVLAVALVRAGQIPRWTGGLIGLAGALYPMSRIPRVQLLAHAADLLLLIPMVYLGVRFLRRSQGRRGRTDEIGTARL